VELWLEENVHCAVAKSRVLVRHKKERKTTEAIIYKNNNSFTRLIDWFLVYKTLYQIQGLFTLTVFGRVFM
jgi:hypothetical protein